MFSVHVLLAYFVYLVVLLGVSIVEVKTKTDSNNMTECSHDVKPTVGMSGCSLQSDISCSFSCLTLIRCFEGFYNIIFILAIDLGCMRKTVVAVTSKPN